MNTHQQLRANLWCNVATGIAVLPEVTEGLTPTRWADRVLKDFDERFPEAGPVDTDPKFAALREERDALIANIHNLQKAYDHVGGMLNDQRDITQKMYKELNELTLERDSQKQWKEDQIELNRRWNDVIDFVHIHPSTQPGQSVCSEALRLMRERDMFRSQLRNADIHPRPLP